jgi:hypothetical protein
MSSNLHRDQSGLARLAGLREPSGFPSRPANESDGPFPAGWDRYLPADRKLLAARLVLADAIAAMLSAAGITLAELTAADRSSEHPTAGPDALANVIPDVARAARALADVSDHVQQR